MKKTFLLSAAIIISIVLVAQEESIKEQMSVQQTIVKLFTALSNSDTTGLKLYSTSNVKLYEYGQIWTIDTLIQKMMMSKTIKDFKRINSFEFINTTISKKTAWITYYLQSTITRNGKQEIIKWMETVILLKEKKQWKINVLHSTRLVKN